MLIATIKGDERRYELQWDGKAWRDKAGHVWKEVIDTIGKWSGWLLSQHGKTDQIHQG